MLVPPPPGNQISVLAIEGGFTAIAFAASFLLPRFGSSFFVPIERRFRQLARHRTLCVILVGAACLLARLAILPIHPIPFPFYTDDFSFLFAGDTFALGRLANPTPAMWTHFETMHIDMLPTYTSMFFPGTGLVLAAGKVLFGNPWFGMLLVTALMCSAICWMLQAWLPAEWALLGGILAVLRIGVFSYWIDTYVGGGPLVALGGALVLGAYPRILKKLTVGNGVFLVLGILILANSRPYEGILLCLPVALALGKWLIFDKPAISRQELMRDTAIPLLLMIAGVLWMGYYNYRSFGNPLTLPYTINRATYAVAPHFIWEKPSPEPIYRYKAIHDYYLKVEYPEYQRIHSVSGFLPETLLKGLRAFLFFAEFALIPPILMSRRLFFDRRIRFLLLCMIPLIVGVTIEAGIRPYYLAPFTAVFYALGLQAMRHLKRWKPGGQPVGNAIVRSMITICVAMAALELGASPLHLGPPSTPGSGWVCECLGANRPGAVRARIQAELERLPGKHVVMVRYAPEHDASEEWVYNSPDLDASKVIWAREAESGDNLFQNEELIHYYKDRHFWLVEPDSKQVTLQAYPETTQSVSVASTLHSND
jgi:hypothetical protein